MSRLRLYNCQLLDGAGLRKGELYIEGDKIAAPGPVDAERDLKGMILMPGLADLHCHLRDPGWPAKETLETGMKAALGGGFTTLVAMANTNPVCATPQLVEENHRRAKELALTRLIQSGAAGLNLEDETPTDRKALSRVTNVITNDGKTIFSDEFMEQLLIDSREYGFLISTHCQPERATVRRDLDLHKKVGGRLHVGHVSHRETAAMIRQAKEAGQPVTFEITPHHVFGWDMEYRVNPPFRSQEDARAMIEAIREGWADCLATDHAPHTPADKEKGMAGISEADWALSIWLTVFMEEGIPLTRLATLGAENPCKLLGIHAGRLEEGWLADLVAFDPEEERVICPKKCCPDPKTPPLWGAR